jgi:flavorubredoxin
MTTVSKNVDVRHELNAINLNIANELLAKAKAGNQLSIVKAVVTGLVATATPDITSAAVKAAAVLSGISLDTGEGLPPIGDILTLRVTSGMATAGARVVTDAGGAAGAPGANGPGVALISDDGKTLTFEATVTGFTISYRPRGIDLSTARAVAEPG